MFASATTRKLRRTILVVVLASVGIPARSNAVDSARIDAPVIATWARGAIAAVWSQPVAQAIADEYSLEVCHDTDCFVARSISRIPYTANSSSTRTSITAYFRLFDDPSNPSSFYTRNNGLPLTATISAGTSPTDPSKSEPSADFYADPPEVSPVDATQQFLQPVLRSLSLSNLNMGVCFNRTSDAFRWRNDSEWPNVGLRFPGYSLMYEVSKDGTVVQSGNSSILGSGIQGNWFNGRYCEDGAEGDDRFGIVPASKSGSRSPNTLDAGTTYTFTYSLVGGASQAASGSLDFTTPGGCPSTPPGPPKHLTASGWSALLDSSGRYMASFQGFSPRQSAYMSATRSASLYLSPYKTFPYDSSYVYIPEIDDFAVDMSGISTNGKYVIKNATIFKDCSPEQVQVAASITAVSGKSDNSACQIVEGNIVPTRVGRCILRVQVTRKPSVTASGARKSESTFTRDLAVNFSSMPAPAPAANTVTPSTSAKSGTVPSIARGKSVSVGQFMTLIGATSPKGSVVRFGSVPKGGSVCAILRARLVAKKAGTCSVRYSIVTRSKKTWRTATIRVS